VGETVGIGFDLLTCVERVSGGDGGIIKVVDIDSAIGEVNSELAADNLK